MIVATALLALCLSVIHVLAGRLSFLNVVPRSRWLSAAGGIAVAYVFLHILPELAAHQETFEEGLRINAEAGEVWVFALALAGLATFYGLERLARTSRGHSRQRGAEDAVGAGVFWLHLGSFAIYNVLIGYLLVHRDEPGPWPLAGYFLAMSMHFLTNDFGLRQDHRDRYDKIGRWLLASAVLAGWALGVVIEVPDIVVAFLFAFLAGGIVLNVLKEELPEERQSRFWPFILSAAIYAAVLIAV
jgi:zinc transporter ZupT